MIRKLTSRLPGAYAPPFGDVGEVELQEPLNEGERDTKNSVSVDVRGLSYAVRVSSALVKTRRRVLLKDINCRAEPCEMLAIMGSTGSGKTTLLDLLAGRKNTGLISGSILFNGGERFEGSAFRRSCAYIQQTDLHHKEVTVRETLMFSAKLRMGGNPEAIEGRVNEMLSMLGLEGCADNLVGDVETRGISGGQRKRLSIAVEMMALPKLIFLDELTSGLDSSTALEVVTSVRRLASLNRTIVCTIHQPSPEAFSLFDKVLVMAAGRQVYYGGIKDAVSYFTAPHWRARYGLRFDFFEGDNPAEFIVSAAAAAPADQLAAEFSKTGFHRTYQVPEWCPSPSAMGMSTPPAVSWSKQLQLVWCRAWMLQMRRSGELYALVGKNFFVGLIVLTVYWKALAIPKDAPLIDAATGEPTAAAATAIALLFYDVLYAFNGYVHVVPRIYADKAIHLREQAAGAYGTSVLWITVTTSVLPLVILCVLVFINIIAWPLGMHMDTYWLFLGLNIFAAQLGVMCCQFISATFKTASTALAVWPLLFTFFSMFAGFSVRLPNLNVWWVWVSQLSYVRWTMQGLVANCFRGFDDREKLLALYGFDRESAGTCLLVVLLWLVAVSAGTLVAFLPGPSRLKRVSNREIQQVIDAEAAVAALWREGQQVKRKTTSLWALLLKLPLVGSSAQRAMARRAHDPWDNQLNAMEAEGADSAAGGFSAQFLSHADFAACTEETVSDKSDLADGSGGDDCRLLFHDISCSIPVAGGGKLQVLSSVSGGVEAGQVLAIMGTSGSGKTTLLDVLARRKTGGGRGITGTIWGDGQGARLSYVMQDDVHMPRLTVQQTLEFAAKLRMHSSTTAQARAHRVDKLLVMLGLAGSRHRVVCDSISGGELKRLSIAVELVNLPHLIFMDEPTTGLDSSTALEVMSCVRSLANQNRAVVCTIHQPSAQMFGLVDRLLLLVDGCAVYFGPAAAAVAALTPLVAPPRTGGSRALRPNPADIILSIASSAGRAKRGDATRLVMACRSSEAWRDITVKAKGARGGSPAGMMLASTYHTTFLRQCWVLTHRGVLGTWQNAAHIRTTVWWLRVSLRSMLARPRLAHRVLFPSLPVPLGSAMIGVFYGVVWWRLPETAIYERFTVLFFSLTFGLLSNQSVIPTLFAKRLLFYRERSAGVCSTSSYWISQIICEIPHRAIATGLFSVVVYHMTGLNPSPGRFWYFFLVMQMLTIVVTSCCMLVASLCRTCQAAVTMYPALAFFFVAFGGFIVRTSSLPAYLGAWAPSCSFIRWGMEGLLMNEFEGEGSVLPDFIYQLVMNEFDFHSASKWGNTLVALASTQLVVGVLGYMALHFLSFERK
ncbi:unnamed protein product [Chrysoparadoxa australica]